MLLRPTDDVLTLTALKYDAEVRDSEDLTRPETPPLKKEEVALTKTLLASFLRDDFDISEFTRADEMALIGENTTNASVHQLKAMLSKLDPRMFPSGHELERESGMPGRPWEAIAPGRSATHAAADSG